MGCTPAGAGDRAIDGGAGDREQLLQFADGVPAGAVQLDQVGLLARAELGLLAAQPALGSGDRHAFAGPYAYLYAESAAVPVEVCVLGY